MKRTSNFLYLVLTSLVLFGITSCNEENDVSGVEDEYKILKEEYNEIEGKREFFESEEGCSSFVFSNKTDSILKCVTPNIYTKVVEASFFESDDFGAFDWIASDSVLLNVPGLLIDNSILWEGTCIYKNGVSTKSYYNDGKYPYGFVTVPASSKIRVSGKMTYCKRVVDYVFTIQNVNTGKQFDINGTWTQIVPIQSHFIISEL